jgi:hypothetical protein
MTAAILEKKPVPRGRTVLFEYLVGRHWYRNQTHTRQVQALHLHFGYDAHIVRWSHTKELKQKRKHNNNNNTATQEKPSHPMYEFGVMLPSGEDKRYCTIKQLETLFVPTYEHLFVPVSPIASPVNIQVFEELQAFYPDPQPKMLGLVQLVTPLELDTNDRDKRVPHSIDLGVVDTTQTGKTDNEHKSPLQLCIVFETTRQVPVQNSNCIYQSVVSVQSLSYACWRTSTEHFEQSLTELRLVPTDCSHASCCLYTRCNTPGWCPVVSIDTSGPNALGHTATLSIVTAGFPGNCVWAFNFDNANLVLLTCFPVPIGSKLVTAAAGGSPWTEDYHCPNRHPQDQSGCYLVFAVEHGSVFCACNTHRNPSRSRSAYTKLAPVAPGYSGKATRRKSRGEVKTVGVAMGGFSPSVQRLLDLVAVPRGTSSVCCIPKAPIFGFVRTTKALQLYDYHKVLALESVFPGAEVAVVHLVGNNKNRGYFYAVVSLLPPESVTDKPDHSQDQVCVFALDITCTTVRTSSLTNWFVVLDKTGKKLPGVVLTPQATRLIMALQHLKTGSRRLPVVRCSSSLNTFAYYEHIDERVSRLYTMVNYTVSVLKSSCSFVRKESLLVIGGVETKDWTKQHYYYQHTRNQRVETLFNALYNNHVSTAM